MGGIQVRGSSRTSGRGKDTGPRAHGTTEGTGRQGQGLGADGPFVTTRGFRFIPEDSEGP